MEMGEWSPSSSTPYPPCRCGRWNLPDRRCPVLTGPDLLQKRHRLPHYRCLRRTATAAAAKVFPLFRVHKACRRHHHVLVCPGGRKEKWVAHRGSSRLGGWGSWHCHGRCCWCCCLPSRSYDSSSSGSRDSSSSSSRRSRGRRGCHFSPLPVVWGSGGRGGGTMGYHRG
ncbi:unnamed protein product [Ectocarpus sp. 12 AP-2014]